MKMTILTALILSALAASYSAAAEPEAIAAAPKPMTAEQKAARALETAYASTLREAVALDVAAVMMDQQALIACKSAAHHKDQAKRNAERFAERARAEEAGFDVAATATTLITLPKSGASNSAAVKETDLAKRDIIRAQLLTQQAKDNRVKAAALREKAARMPRGN